MSSENEKKKYSREEYIYLSKLYTKAEEYKKVIEFIEEFIKLNPKLDKEECDILSTGFKNMITDKRASWFTLNSMERKEKKKKKNTVKEIKEIKNHIENELREICNKLQEIIDKELLKNKENEIKSLNEKIQKEQENYQSQINKYIKKEEE